MSLTTRTKVKPPKELSATYSAVGGFAVTLRWTPVESGAQRSYFVVYRDDIELATGITENSYRDATVLEGEEHVYSVATVNVNETEGAPITIPEVQLPYYPVWQDGWSLSLIQGATSDVSARASDPRGTALTFDRNGGTAPAGVTFSSVGVISIGASVVAGDYDVGLRATGVSGLASTYSLQLTIQALLQAPGTPINLVVGAASTSALNVSWDRAASGSAPADYTVEYSTSASGPWTDKPHSGTATSTQITGLSTDTLYYVRVSASNSAGSSSYITASGRTNASAGQADFIIPVSTAARTISNATTTAYGSTSWASLATGSKTKPQAGDIIELAAGTHGKITLTINGTSSGDITVRANQSARSILSVATTFVLTVDSCTYLTIDGGTIGSQYGLLITAPSASSGVGHFIKYAGFNHHVTLKNFEVDGKITSFSAVTGVPIGVGLHDNTLLRTAYPGVFQQHDNVVENFYVHNVKGEGIYGGPNFSTGACPLKNMTIRNGLIEDTGRDAIQVKCWWEGTNKIHGIVGRRIGLNSNDEAGQRFGVSVLSGQADVYDIDIDGCGESGVQFYTQSGPDAGVTFNGFGPYTAFNSKCYNALIANAGQIDTGTVNTGHGVTVSTDSSARVKTTPQIFNITAVNCEGYGVNIGTAGAGFVRNSVLIGNGLGAYTLGSGGTTQSNNKTTGTLTAEYRLTAEDAAVGTIGTDISATDLDGVSRSGTASKGAYEYA